MAADKPGRHEGKARPKVARPRSDVRALLDLMAIDDGSAKHETEAPGELPELRKALLKTLPGPAVERYEKALSLGRQPAAIATRGTVCWGCFRRLPLVVSTEFRTAKRFVPCPHCDRLLYDPEWEEERL